MVNDLLRMYYRPVKVKPNTSPEYERFASALKTVLRVSHSELKAALEAEKKAKKRKQRRSKHAAASPRFWRWTLEGFFAKLAGQLSKRQTLPGDLR